VLQQAGGQGTGSNANDSSAAAHNNARAKSGSAVANRRQPLGESVDPLLPHRFKPEDTVIV